MIQKNKQNNGKIQKLWQLDIETENREALPQKQRNKILWKTKVREHIIEKTS